MQRTASLKEQKHIPLTENGFQKVFRDLFHPLLMKLAGTAVRFEMIADNDYTPLPDRPILFAGNHYCGQDVIIACNLIHGRTVVVAGKQPLTPVDEFFFHMNGTIFVDRKDRRDTAACKRAMQAQLLRGQQVIIFPEGTSNVSDALPMYPMKWGIIEVAQKTHAQIIPMVLHYDRTSRECHVRFGSPLIADDLTKAEGIALLRDTMAAMRWDYFRQGGTVSRRELDLPTERRRNSELLLSYKLLDYEYERSVVFHPAPDEAEVYAPICRAYAVKMGGEKIFEKKKNSA